MGTYCDNLTRKEQIEKLTDSREFSSPRFTKATLLKKALRGNHLWTAWEVQTTEKTVRYIHLDLLRGNKWECWYKPMDESVHPYYYDCPVSFFNLVPDTEEFTNSKWREKVRMYAECDKHFKRLKDGELLHTTTGQYTVVKLPRRRGIIGECVKNGTLYRIRKHTIDKITKNSGEIIILG